MLIETYLESSARAAIVFKYDAWVQTKYNVLTLLRSSSLYAIITVTLLIRH